MSTPRIIPADVSQRADRGRRSGHVGLRLGQCRLRQDACAGAARHQPAAARRRSGEDSLHHLHQGGRRQYGEPRVRHAGRMERRSPTTALDEKIRLSTGQAANAAQRARARRLFASALETPGGLKVQTIHAFCTRLLHQFPFEANVAARFTVLDEADDDATARQADARRAAARPRPTPRQRARPGAGDRHRGRRRPDLQGRDRRRHPQARRHRAWIERAGSVDAAMAELSRSFGLDPDDSAEALELEYFSQVADPGERMAGADRGSGERLQDRQRPRRYARRRAGKLSGATASRAISIFSAPTNASRARTSSPRRSRRRIPDWCERLDAEQTTRLRSAGARARAGRARPHPRAGHHRRRGDRPLRARKGSPRAARLRRPDRQDARSVRALVGGLGAVQARSSASTTC